MHNHHFDSTIWNDFAFREGDIVISTYGKSGTTWVQQIVGQLLFDGAADVSVGDLSPWLDLRVPPKPVKLEMMEAQAHRRFLKTHLPVDALVYSPRARYIYIGRDGRDVVWSLWNHHARANTTWYEVLNDTPGLVGPRIGRPPSDIRDYFLEWLERDGHPFWSFWDNVSTCWQIRHLPNVMFLHFAELKADLPGAIRRIAEFLGVPIHPGAWPAILEHCSFAWMKTNGEKAAPLGGALWEGGGQTFIHKGTNGRWRDMLTAEDCRRYEAMARMRLGEECARWLATGEFAAPVRAAA
jgi:aryl sulfotransferase